MSDQAEHTPDYIMRFVTAVYPEAPQQEAKP